MDDMTMDSSKKMKMKMHMNFYWGKDAIVLFSGWPEHSLGMYILSIILTFVLALLCELFSHQPASKRRATPVVPRLYQAVLYVFHISFHYLVMLAVMSFNIGIFIAAILGHTLGFLIFKYRHSADDDNHDDDRSMSSSQPYTKV